MKRIKVIVEYDGTNYAGWQRQENAIAIQQIIEETLYKLTGRTIVIYGAGRTDTGVHAYGQVFHFDDDTMPPERYAGALNSKLPFDIRAISSCEVNKDFHSRFDAKGKTYVYNIINVNKPIAIKRNYAWKVFQTLDITRMRDGAKHLIGEHDFASFMAARSFVHTSVRRIDKVDIEKDGDNITITITGNGFLRSMVRIIAGTLVEIGYGKRNPEDMIEIINARCRKAAGITAPSCGLYLMEVYYD